MDENLIKKLLESRTEAIRKKEINGVMAVYSKDVLVFDLVTPLQYKGADAYRKNWEDWFTTWEGPIDYEIHDLQIFANAKVAFAHSLNRIKGKRVSGEETDVWVRGTVGLQKVEGKWLVVHEHLSVPFYMDGSYKAAVDLEP